MSKHAPNNIKLVAAQREMIDVLKKNNIAIVTKDMGYAGIAIALVDLDTGGWRQWGGVPDEEEKHPFNFTARELTDMSDIVLAVNHTTLEGLTRNNRSPELKAYLDNMSNEIRNRAGGSSPE